MEARQFEYDEDDCPGHVAMAPDGKRCSRCGVHVDALRPDDDETPDCYGCATMRHSCEHN